MATNIKPDTARPEHCRVQSADGTAIAYTKTGTGPALILCHGSLSTGYEWLPVAQRLADRYTCYVMTRRGRGRSGNGPDYALQRECEDIAALLDVAGGHAHLLGHSYGALCALETARQSNAIERLVLYEPPLPITPLDVATELEAYRTALAGGRLEDALLTGFRTFVGMPETELAALQKMLLWPGTLQLAPTWLPELEAITALPPGAAHYTGMNAQTLLLLGTQSAQHLRHAITALQAALPLAETVTLAGQGHSAHIMAPARIATIIGDFLTAA